MSSALDFDEAAALTKTALTFPELLADAKRIGCFHRLAWAIATVGDNRLSCFVPLLLIWIWNYLHFALPKRKGRLDACPVISQKRLNYGQQERIPFNGCHDVVCVRCHHNFFLS